MLNCLPSHCMLAKCTTPNAKTINAIYGVRDRFICCIKGRHKKTESVHCVLILKFMLRQRACIHRLIVFSFTGTANQVYTSTARCTLFSNNWCRSCRCCEPFPFHVTNFFFFDFFFRIIFLLNFLRVECRRCYVAVLYHTRDTVCTVHCALCISFHTTDWMQFL